MSLARFEETIADANGNALPFANIIVRHHDDLALATIYNDAEAVSVKSAAGAMQANNAGKAVFYALPGLYNLAFTYGSFQGSVSEYKLHDNEEIIEEGSISRTLSLPDVGNYINGSNSSGIDIDIPLEAVAGWHKGNKIHFRQDGAGAFTFNALTGVALTVPALGTNVSAGTGATLALVYKGSDLWDLIGHTVAA